MAELEAMQKQAWERVVASVEEETHVEEVVRLEAEVSRLEADAKRASAEAEGRVAAVEAQLAGSQVTSSFQVASSPAVLPSPYPGAQLSAAGWTLKWVSHNQEVFDTSWFHLVQDSLPEPPQWLCPACCPWWLIH